MNSNQPPGETETKSREDWITWSLAILIVFIPDFLHHTLRLPLSWGYVFVFAVTSTLAYFFLPGAKKNIGRFVQLNLAFCVVLYLIGRFLR